MCALHAGISFVYYFLVRRRCHMGPWCQRVKDREEPSAGDQHCCLPACVRGNARSNFTVSSGQQNEGEREEGQLQKQAPILSSEEKKKISSPRLRRFPSVIPLLVTRNPERLTDTLPPPAAQTPIPLPLLACVLRLAPLPDPPRCASVPDARARRGRTRHFRGGHCARKKGSASAPLRSLVGQRPPRPARRGSPLTSGSRCQ